jgi:hypothetical protein
MVRLVGELNRTAVNLSQKSTYRADLPGFGETKCHVLDAVTPAWPIAGLGSSGVQWKR